VVVGYAAAFATQHYRAYRWTATGGVRNLGTLVGGTYSKATGVSADGSVVVGVADNVAGRDRAFRWTEAEGMQSLGSFSTTTSSSADRVSADGLVVVGYAYAREMGQRAFRWRLATDFNNDRVVNSQDFYEFLGAFFTLMPSADFNSDGEVNSADLLGFLDVFIAGC
jgi:probable HAF family extracellular repeat protein